MSKIIAADPETRTYLEIEHEGVVQLETIQAHINGHFTTALSADDLRFLVDEEAMLKNPRPPLAFRRPTDGQEIFGPFVVVSFDGIEDLVGITKSLPLAHEILKGLGYRPIPEAA